MWCGINFGCFVAGALDNTHKLNRYATVSSHVELQVTRRNVRKQLGVIVYHLRSVFRIIVVSASNWCVDTVCRCSSHELVVTEIITVFIELVALFIW